MTEFLPWISKKKLSGFEERIAELEEKVKELDPENVSEELRKATRDLSTWTSEAKQEVMKVVNKEITKLASRLDEQDKKIADFIYLSKENTVRAIAGSFEIIRRILGITEEELDRITKEEKQKIKK